ncbi:MAG TPA: SDR family oxidoreductase [Candidatus Binataceae bacterium]|nr:SDR family oxidoreductase [Candidatus Binataceae bacterium]
MAKRKVLVTGASGVVGMGAVRHFAETDGWDVTGVSRRLPPPIKGAELNSLDLLDRKRCEEVFGQMADVTDVVFAALNEKPGLFEGWQDRQQMEINLTMLRNTLEPLEAVAKNLNHISLLQGTKAYGVHLGPIAIPARERSPRHQHENFYFLQEDYLRTRQQGKRWHWTVWRPQLVIGEAIGANLNVIPPLGVYAAIRREAGLPLCFPGGDPFVFEMVDTDLLGKAYEWAAGASTARNEIFNITNGDVFVWQELWPAIADAFGMRPGPHEPVMLSQELLHGAEQWASIVRKYNLAAPTDLKTFIGESIHVVDFAMGCGMSDRPPILVSTVKLRQAGFHDCIDSEDMMRKWIKRYQEARLLPPV